MVGGRVWSLIVIGTDALLLVSAREEVVTCVAALTCLWLLVSAAEDAVAFGLYEFGAPETVSVCDCSHPPCPIGVGNSVSNVMRKLVTFLIDLSLTRFFATSMFAERRRTLETVRIALAVAECLAIYDVDSAELLM
eukprot:gene33938-27739_t